MPNAAELVKLIKKTAIEAVEATKPVTVCYGGVTSMEPLKINVEQRLTLGAMQLILTKAAAENLAVGSRAILLRQQGGQKYIVLDVMAE